MLTWRHLLMGLALVVTAGASIVEWPGDDPAPASKSPKPVAQTTPAARMASVANGGDAPAPKASDATPQRQRFAPATADLFAAQSWLPPPPPPPKVAPPLAPALPFRYLGKVLDGSDVLVFVGEGVRTHLLRKGDALPGYQVADVTATYISFVYLPLQETQRLTFGSAN